MTPEQFARLKQVFVEADELPAPERRASIEATLADDQELLDFARSMLDAEQAHGEGSTSGVFASAIPQDALPEHIGPYRVVRKLGAGAVGTVYEAEQTSPQRSVAIKVLGRAEPTGRLARRFELEAEILGRLRHPGIAQVFQSGVAHADQGGAPFIAMELVRGEPITRWAMRTNAPLERRLETIALVCDAVHHAHMRGIIHRDLKPANIFIDEHGLPKVLDFGIARALEGVGDSHAVETMQGEVLGTLDYMSPEQAGGDAQVIDVRTDVYALGAVLFELIAGKTPIETRDMTLASALDAARSAQRSRLRETTLGVSSDLDIITQTAIDPDRERRYPSASALGEDIRRMLRKEPILARAPSMSYQLLKFAQRRRAAFIASSVSIAALSAATLVSIVFATSANNARAIAERERTEAEQTLGLLTSALSAANPDQSGSSEYSLGSFLADVAEDLDREDVSINADSIAQVRSVIGDAFIGLAQPRDAETQFALAADARTESLGPSHEETIRLETMLGVAMMDAGDLERARAHLERVVRRADESLGIDHQTAMLARNFLASVFYKQGDAERAEPHFRQLVSSATAVSGPSHPDTVAYLGSLGIVLQQLDKLDEALDVSERSLRATIETYGDDHPYTLSALSNHGLILSRLERFDEAGELLRDVLESRRRVLPPDHRHIGVSLLLLAQLHRDTGVYETAEGFALDAHAHFLRTLGEAHGYTQAARRTCASIYDALGREADARVWRQESDPAS